MIYLANINKEMKWEGRGYRFFRIWKRTEKNVKVYGFITIVVWFTGEEHGILSYLKYGHGSSFQVKYRNFDQSTTESF